MTSRTSKPRPATTARSDKSSQSQNNQQPISNDQNHILYLQRTIGNHAVTQLLAAQRPVITQSGSASLPLKIQRKIMTYNEFFDYTGQRGNRQKQDIFEGETGKAELDAERQQINPQAGALHDEFVHHADINHAYYWASSEDSIEALTALHDTIVYWLTLFGHLPSSAGQKPILDGVLAATSKRVQELIVEDNKKKDKFGADLLNKGKTAVKSAKDSVVPGRRDAANFDDSDFVAIPKMPNSMKKVGIPNEYFIENFVDMTTGKLIEDRTRYFDSMINVLEEDKENSKGIATLIFDELGELGVKDFYLLKSVVFAHFGIVLDKIAGTDRDATIGQPLTKEEVEAIIRYSGGAYTAINREARAALPAAKLAPGVRPAKSAPVDSQKQTMQLAVSGLNKLPKYQGKLYRGLAFPPAGFAAYAYEGAVIGDLGFSSASPAITAVYDFLELQSSPKNIFYVLDSKTATNILSLSANVQEGEVLFRPGTRFQITKIWKHDAEGKVPEDAPADVQMMLHKKGDYVNSRGRAVEPSDGKRYQTQVIMATEI